MLDIQFIRDNPEEVAKKSEQKNYPVDVHKLLELDGRRRKLLGQGEELRQERNVQAASTKGQRPTDEQIAKGKELKEQLNQTES